MSDDNHEDVNAKPSELTKLHDTAVKRFKRFSDAWSKQRQREKADLRFQVPEFQWDDRVRAERDGDQAANIPPRPTLSIPKLQQPIQLVLNQERQSELGVNIHPLSPDANQDTAEVIQGLYRKIERDSQAGQARTWAFDRAAKAGMGFWLVNTEYDEAGGNPFDQVIRIQRILNQDGVFLDPSSQKPDFSDGEAAYITAWMPKAQFEREYPKAQIPTAEAMKFETDTSIVPDWVKGDGDDEAYMIAWEFYKKHRMTHIALLETGEVVPFDEAPSRVKILADRMQDQVEVWSCKHSAIEIVEEPTKWNGKYIPIIPALGSELQPFNDQRYWVGMIGPAKDAQRFHNYAASSLVERMALEPKAPFIGAAGQFEGFEKKWQQANIRNWPFLEYNLKDVAGTSVGAPQRAQIDQSGMSVAAMALQESDGWIQAITSTFDASLGKLSQKDRSGIAIERQQSQSDASNSHYLHNLADVSLAYEAKVILDMIPNIYDTPGRVVRTLDLEDNSKAVMLNQPHVMDQQGQPQAIPEGQPLPEQAKQYDLRKGVYSVAVTIGKSYQTKLEAGASEMSEILQAMPNLFPILGPLWLKYRDFPGHDEMAKLLTKVRDGQYPMLAQPDDGQQASPEQLQAQLQAAQQQVQQLQQQLQQAGQAIQTDQAKQQATLQKAQMDNQTKVQTSASSDAVKLQIAHMQAEIDLIKAGMGHEQESSTQHMDLAHDTAMSAMDHAESKDLATHQAGEDAKMIAAQAALQSFKGPNEQGMGSEEGI